MKRTCNVVMIRPASFGFNAETASSNVFQSRAAAATASGALAARAREEFDASVALLRASGVHVDVVDDADSPEESPRPDAVFPNNWLQLRGDGVAVLFPMATANRRVEMALLPVVLRALRSSGFAVARVDDRTVGAEAALEGTGSLVFDHYARVVYACESPRTDGALAAAYCAELGFSLRLFAAHDEAGIAVYHTNVLMAVTERAVVACTDAMDLAGRVALRESAAARGAAIVEIDRGQMAAFAGNMLELAAPGGGSLLVMSSRANAALRPEQRAALERACDAFVVLPLDVVESVGGGSARCMIAENFLPRVH